jgi:hypothetical protein
MDLTRLENARNQMNDAQRELESSAKSVINEAVKELLDSPDISNVVWAQKSSEYNDEGMYPGVAGPHLNVEGVDDDFDPYDLEDRWGLMETYGSVDQRASDLKKVFDLLGEEILSDLFGDEHLVVATLNGDRVQYATEYAGV